MFVECYEKTKIYTYINQLTWEHPAVRSDFAPLLCDTSFLCNNYHLKQYDNNKYRKWKYSHVSTFHYLFIVVTRCATHFSILGSADVNQKWKYKQLIKVRFTYECLVCYSLIHIHLYKHKQLTVHNSTKLYANTNMELYIFAFAIPHCIIECTMWYVHVNVIYSLSAFHFNLMPASNQFLSWLKSIDFSQLIIAMMNFLLSHLLVVR